MSSGNWRPFCLALIVLIVSTTLTAHLPTVIIGRIAASEEVAVGQNRHFAVIDYNPFSF